MYENPELMRAYGKEHHAQLIAEAAQERLVARLGKSNSPLAQVREELKTWHWPGRRIAVKGI